MSQSSGLGAVLLRAIPPRPGALDGIAPPSRRAPRHRTERALGDDHLVRQVLEHDRGAERVGELTHDVVGRRSAQAERVNRSRTSSRACNAVVCSLMMRAVHASVRVTNLTS
jgi:hypothetical protein